MDYQAFVTSIKTIKSLAVVEKSDVILLIVRGAEQPFLTIRKSDRALSLSLENFTASQLDFSQVLVSLGTLFMQGDSVEFMKNLVVISDSSTVAKPKTDTVAVIKNDGSIVADGNFDISTDRLSLLMIKWLMNLFISESTDPILGLVGVARMVEAKWNYSVKNQVVKSSNGNSNEKHVDTGIVGGDEVQS